MHVNGTASKLKMAAILEHNDNIPVYGEIIKFFVSVFTEGYYQKSLWGSRDRMVVVRSNTVHDEV